MKFYNLYAFNNYNDFEVSHRNILDLILLHKLVFHSNRESLLEIGYYDGFTFSVLYESSAKNAKLESCDITYSKDQFRKNVNLSKDCVFHECSSLNLKLSSSYDFINIDGNHTYDFVSKELKLILPHTKGNTIIMIDDFFREDISVAVKEFLKYSNFEPFLIGHQQLFLKPSSYVVDELIETLKKDLKSISTWSKIFYEGYYIDNYQYKHNIFIHKLKNLVKTIDI